MVSNQLASLYVNAPSLPLDTIAQVADNVQPSDELAHDEQEGNHVNTPRPLADEDHTQLAGTPESQSANVPPTEDDVQPPVQPAHDVQDRDAIPPPPLPPEDHTPPPANAREATTNNQLSDRVGDGSVQLRRLAADGDSPTLEKEEHFVPAPKASVRRHQSLPQERLPFNEELQSQATVGALKPRWGSRSSRDDPDVRRGSVPAPLSPLVHGFSASPQSPRSPKKRRVSISSFSSKRQSQIEDEETMLLEPPKSPRGPLLSSKRQSKSATDEKTNLLKELSPEDDEHPTLGDGHTSDDP